MGDKKVCELPKNINIDPILQAYLATVDKENSQEVQLTKAEVKAYLDNPNVDPKVKAENLAKLTDLNRESPKCNIFSKDALKLVRENGFDLPKEARALGFATHYYKETDSYVLSAPVGIIWLPGNPADPKQKDAKFTRIEWDAKRNALVVESNYELTEFRCDTKNSKITIVELDPKTRKIKNETTYDSARNPEVLDGINYLKKNASNMVAANFTVDDLRKQFDVPSWLNIRAIEVDGRTLAFVLESKDGRIITSGLLGDSSEMLISAGTLSRGVWNIDGDADMAPTWQGYSCIGAAIESVAAIGMLYEARQYPTSVKIGGVDVAAFNPPSLDGKYLFISQMGAMLIYDPTTKKMTLGHNWERISGESARLTKNEHGLCVEITTKNRFGEVLKVDFYKIEWMEKDPTVEPADAASFRGTRVQ